MDGPLLQLNSKGLKQGKDSEDTLYLIRALANIMSLDTEVMKSQAWLLSGGGVVK